MTWLNGLCWANICTATDTSSMCIFAMFCFVWHLTHLSVSSFDSHSRAVAVDGGHERGPRGAVLPKPKLSGVTRILELERHSVPRSTRAWSHPPRFDSSYPHLTSLRFILSPPHLTSIHLITTSPHFDSSYPHLTSLELQSVTNLLARGFASLRPHYLTPTLGSWLYPGVCSPLLGYQLGVRRALCL